MAYHDQDMAFTNKDNMQRLVLQTTTTTEAAAASTADNKPPPTWLNNAILQQQNDDVVGPAPNSVNNSDVNNNIGREDDWESVKCKAEILGHPLYEQLLSAHVSCLKIATPVDQLPRIDAQLGQSQDVLAKYSAVGNGVGHLVDTKELDQFMVAM